MHRIPLVVALVAAAAAHGHVLHRREGASGEYAPTLTFLHTNDVHARLDQFNKYGTDCSAQQIAANACFGGVARIKSVVDQYRARAPNTTLLFDAGDQFQGTMFYSHYRGNVSAEAMNVLRYDAMTVGNHEFDDGPLHLAKFVRKLNFPMISANMILDKQPALQGIIHPYITFPQHNLAVIGFITNTTGFISSAGPTVGFVDAVPAVQKVVDILREQGYRRIIAVSHNGYAEDQDVARRTRGLDLIVGGHSHTYLSADPKDPESKGLYPTKIINLEGEPTFIVQAQCWGKYVGHLDVTFDARGVISDIQGAPILLDQSVPQDAELQSRVLAWRQVFDELGRKEIGSAAQDMPNAPCQTQECAIGNLITDAMMAARNTPQTPKAVRFAVLNSGGIRAGLAKGVVRQQDVTTMLPFGNALMDISLTGAQLRELIESVVSKKNRRSNRPVTSFAQLAGLRVTYDSRRAEFSRVLTLEIEVQDAPGTFEPVIDDHVYAGTTLDFLVNGGDAFFAEPPGKLIPLAPIDEAVKSFIGAKSPLRAYAGPVGRITDVSQPPPAPKLTPAQKRRPERGVRWF